MSFDEKLIEEVRKNGALYDALHNDYRNTYKRSQIWVDIAENLNSSTDICRKRWKGLRDTFIKYRRRDSLRSGYSKRDLSKKWKYFELLMFLDDFRDSRAVENFTLENSTKAEIKWDSSSEYDETQNTDIFHPGEKDAVSLEQVENLFPEPMSSSLASTSHRSSQKDGEHSDDFNKMFCEFLDKASKSITETFSHQNKDSTIILFEVLATKVKNANLPQAVVNEIEAEVSALVYDKLAKYSN